MPSSPEFGRALGNEGVVEVLEDVEAEYLTKTDSHIGVAREVEVDIKGNRDRVDPVHKHGLFLCRVHDLAEVVHRVCDEDLLRETDNEAARALAEHREVVMSFLKLEGNVVVTYDGTRDKLGEHRNVSREVYGVLLRLLAAVYVNDVGNDLEGVEGDTDGKNDLEKRDRGSENLIEVIYKEVHILEVEHKGNYAGYGKSDEQLGNFTLTELLDKKSEDVSENDRDDHQSRILYSAPRVEEEGKDKKNGVLCLKGHDIIKKDYRGKEVK